MILEGKPQPFLYLLMIFIAVHKLFIIFQKKGKQQTNNVQYITD